MVPPSEHRRGRSGAGAAILAVIARAAFAGFFAVTAAITAPAADQADPTYVLSGTLVLGGTGACTGIACDVQRQRLYISRTDHVQILATAGMPLGAITVGSDLRAPVLVGNRAFFANGADPLQVVSTAPFKNLGGITLPGPAGNAVSDPGGMVYAALPDAHALVPFVPNLAPSARPGPAIALGGVPTGLCADGHGHVFAIIDDQDSIAVVATATATVTAMLPIHGHHPVSLTCDPTDPTNTELFVACADRHLLFVDGVTGAIRGDLPLAGTPGDCVWSGGAVLVISPAGSLTVARPVGPGGYAVAQTLTIPRGASHLAVDGLGVVFVPSELYPDTGDTAHPVANGFRLLMISRLPQLAGSP